NAAGRYKDCAPAWTVAAPYYSAINGPAAAPAAPTAGYYPDADVIHCPAVVIPPAPAALRNTAQWRYRLWRPPFPAYQYRCGRMAIADTWRVIHPGQRYQPLVAGRYPTPARRAALKASGSRQKSTEWRVMIQCSHHFDAAPGGCPGLICLIPGRALRRGSSEQNRDFRARSTGMKPRRQRPVPASVSARPVMGFAAA